VKVLTISIPADFYLLELAALLYHSLVTTQNHNIRMFHITDLLKQGSCNSRLWTEASAATFLPRDVLVHSAVLRLHVVRPSVCPSVRPSVRPSVCNVGGSGSHRLEILFIDEMYSAH